ncbi:hypothetical protein [Vibrio sp.]|uniref:hypothetical protein n=1 Tax=Vibrio sp. TaxID=678 RepID=UPI003D108315
MRWIWILLLSLSCVTAAHARGYGNDLTQFDLPLLLGDWYLINPSPEDSKENFRAIKMTLASNYRFSIDIQKKDYSVDHWEGEYAATRDSLILGLNTEQPQIYEYQGTHNMLHLNGVTFTKALSNALAGIWSSAHLAGDGLLASKVERMDLILQPDFVFLFRVANDSGDEAIHRGVYYTEGDHLVLLYENGEHDTRYTLNRDQLTLEEEEGSMYAVMNRIR